MKRRFTAALAALFIAISLIAGLPVQSAAQPAEAKNVIVLIADGCGVAHYTLLRWWKGGPLAMDPYLKGAVKTYIANSVVADSAPAATALATGVRSGGRVISVSTALRSVPKTETVPPDQRYVPLATVLEGARLLGKATGLVATSRITHATPAGYAAHVESRKRENEIMLQMVYQGLDVALGGGRRYALPKEQGGKRKDGRDLVKELRSKGYSLPTNKTELQKVTRAPVFGMFGMSHMAAQIDSGEFAPNQPSLTDMARKALEILSQNPDGFFLMIEGSQIDWASHANDPAQLMGELTQFDQACQIALDFAKQHPGTLVVALSDHDTGGLSIGNGNSDINYMTMQLDALLAPIRNMKLSAWGIWQKLGDSQDTEMLEQLLKQYWGQRITADHATEIFEIAAKAQKYPGKFEPHYGIGQVICRDNTLIGWTTHGHVGNDVPLYAFGPGAPSGLLDAPQIGQKCAEAMGLDLYSLNQRLFVDLNKAFGPRKLEVRTPENARATITITHGGRRAVLMAGTNKMTLDGKDVKLEGLSVYVPETGRAFAPRQAVNLIKGDRAALPEITVKAD